ncbi:MAG: HD domain-containing protein [Devosia sp.]
MARKPADLPTAVLTDRLSDAFAFAERAHRSQRRKGSGVPYVAHLMSVCALVLEYGGDEDLAIAALLHDAVEDQGGMAMATTIRQRYGERVADIVVACSDAHEVPKPPWRARKDAYIAAIPEKSDDAVLVSMADKLHNASTIVMDHRTIGSAVWERFTGRQEGTLWYYRALADAFHARAPGPLSDRLSEMVDTLEREAAPLQATDP